MAGVLSFAWPRFNIGIDYIVRLKNPPEGAAGFVCFLCEENTDDGPSHVASDSHRQRYLVRVSRLFKPPKSNPDHSEYIYQVFLVIRLNLGSEMGSAMQKWSN